MKTNATEAFTSNEETGQSSFRTLLISRRSIPAWLSFVLGAVFTAWASYGIHEQYETSAEELFKVHVAQIVTAIHKRLRDHESILLGGAGLMDTNPEVNRQQWRDYVERLELENRYPGIMGVGYSIMLSPNEVDAHIQAVRREGFPAFTVRPEGKRDLYSSIIYLEPFSGRNLAAFGYDMYSNPMRREAMDRAVETNTTSISGKVRLVQETHGKEQAGFLMYVPIYQHGYPLDQADQRWQALRGFVYSPYRMDDLMAGIFNRDVILVDFKLYDGDVISDEGLMFDSSVNEKASEYHLNTQEVLLAYGRAWTLRVTAREGFDKQFETSLDWTVPLMGGGISLSVFMTMLVLLWRRESAEQLANRMIEQNQHASERFHQQLSDVLSAASQVAIIATDKDGMITVFNTGAERLLGYQAEEVVHKQSPAIFHDMEEVKRRSEELSKELGEHIEGFRTFVEIPERDGFEKREWTYIHKLGYTLSVSLVATPVRDAVTGEITGYLGMAEDISERKRVDHLKSEFVSTVSHELRTPLTAISGALKLIASGMIGPLNDKTKELLNIAVNNSERLAHLVNDLLDFERITGGQLQFDFQVQPLKPLIERALESHQTYSVKEHVKLKLSGTIPELKLNIDAQRFMQVLANLISNAIKFSPPEGEVTLFIEPKADRLRITVADQGPGIPSEFERRIFERFAQADSSDTRQKGGTGLGLAISKELIEGMHGEIGFYNHPDQGAAFWIELPTA